MISATKVSTLLLYFILADSGYSQSRYHNRVIARYNLSSRTRREPAEKIQKNNDCKICEAEDITGYPDASIRALIKKNMAVHSYFGDPIIKPVNASITIGSRINGEQPQTLCQTVDKTISPRYMTDINKTGRVIANVDDFKQLITIQTCSAKEDEECFKGGPLNHKTRCMQKFHVIKLLTVEDTEDTLRYRSFEIPSTCVCTFVKEI